MLYKESFLFKKGNGCDHILGKKQLKTNAPVKVKDPLSQAERNCRVVCM